MAIYLHTPAMVSALGCGIDAHMRALLNPPTTSPLTFSSDWVCGHTLAFGAVQDTLRPFAEHTRPEHRSRNNQLLWHALAQIEDQIMQAKQRYGAERIAVIIGTSVSGADENMPLFQHVAQGGAWSDIPFNQQAQLHSDPADFVKQVYQLEGIAYGVSTACTSGARALISAMRLLNLGVCDAVICGGVDTLSPLTINGFHALNVLSDGIANPFSLNRDGINIGEACAVFMMTREAQAESLCLLGYGASSDAYHMSSPHPEGIGAIHAFTQALQHTQLSAQHIGWVNLHGTGTRHNDSMESRAVAHVFGKNTPATSTKSLTGHTLGAAGALEAAIVWCMVSRQYNPQGQLPPHLWDGITDPELAEICLTDTQSQWQAGRRIGASSSFAFGGNNAVLIIGENEDA